MSLREWLANRWVTEHRTDKKEIAGMLGAIVRDLSDCSAEGLSSDGRMSIAYSAALKSASTALAAVGYRAAREQYHHRVIHSLAYTIELDPALIMELDQFRKKRNISTYEAMGMVSDFEADRMIELAGMLYERVFAWLMEFHPELCE